MLKRTEESFLTSWYFEIDRKLLFAVLLLVLVGVWASLTAGSVAAERLNPPQPWHFFFARMLKFYALGLATLFIASNLNRRHVLGLSAANVAVCMLLLLMTLVMPSATKGSARWVSIFGISMMPADLMKPGFVIMTAWFLDYLQRISGGNIFSFDKRLWKWDGWPAYLALFGMILLILLRQPDFGTFGLYMAVFGTMIFLAGLPWKLIPVLGGVAAAGGVFAFMTLSHVRGRILSFIGLEGGADTYQVRKSVEAIKSGGLFGSGEDSFVKQSLPDSHTDFIYSAIAEDSGAILAVVLIFGLLFVLKRLSDNAAQTRDRFIFYVAGGVFALFGFQVSINIATAMGLIPTTGMTLPFISYGGSSFLAFCLLFGLLLALVREDRWK